MTMRPLLTHTQVRNLLLILAGLLVSTAASAAIHFDPVGADTWDFYAYGNGQAVAAIFTGLVQIVKTDTFKTLCIALATVGFLSSGAIGFAAGKPAKFAGYFVGLILIIVFVFNVKMDLFVQEMVYVPGQIPTATKVENVPGAIGIPMVVISEVGQKLTEMMQTYMTSPDPSHALPPGTLPFGAGLGIANDMQHLRIRNQYLQNNFNNWVAACFRPRLYSGEINMTNIASSTNIMDALSGTLAATSQSQFFKMRFLNGSTTTSVGATGGAKIIDYDGVVNCQEGFGYLKSQLNYAVGKQISGIGGQISPQMLQGAALGGQAGLQIAEQALGASMGDATTMATQGAVIDLFNGTSKHQAQALGDDTAMLALNLNHAQRSQKSGWYTASVLFRDMGGYFYAILQCFLIGITPLICALLFFPGMGAKLGGSYIKACIWLASWWPTLQIVNYIMELYYRSGVAAAAGGAGGLTMVNAGLVSHFSDNIIIAAGFMATLVPTIMWGVINGGGFALTMALDRASGSGYATQAGEAAANSNFRAGNVGMNSLSANKYDDSITYQTGTHAAQAYYGAGAIASSIDRGGPKISQNGGNITSTTSVEAQRALSQATSRQQQIGHTLTSQASAASVQAAGQQESMADSWTTNTQGGHTTTSADAFSQERKLVGNTVDQYNLLASTGHETAAHKLFEANVGVGISKILDSGTSWKGVDKNGNSQSFSIQQNKNGSISMVDGQGKTVNSTEGRSYGTSGAINQNGVSGQSYSRTDTTNQMESTANSYGEATHAVDQAQASLSTSSKTSVPLAANQNTAESTITRAGNIGGQVGRTQAADQKTVDDGRDTQQGVVDNGLNDGNEAIANRHSVVDGGVATVAANASGRVDSNQQAVTDERQRLRTENGQQARKSTDTQNESAIKRHDTLMSQVATSPDPNKKQALKAEAQHALEGVSGFEKDGTYYGVSGTIGAGDSMEPVYRTGSNLNNARYYTVDDNGDMQELRVDDAAGAALAGESGEQQYVSSQVNNLGEAMDQLGTVAAHGNGALSDVNIHQQAYGNTDTGLSRVGSAQTLVDQAEASGGDGIAALNNAQQAASQTQANAMRETLANLKSSDAGVSATADRTQHSGGGGGSTANVEGRRESLVLSAARDENGDVSITANQNTYRDQPSYIRSREQVQADIDSKTYVDYLNASGGPFKAAENFVMTPYRMFTSYVDMGSGPTSMEAAKEIRVSGGANHIAPSIYEKLDGKTQHFSSE